MLSLPYPQTLKTHAQNNENVRSSDHDARVYMSYGNVHDRETQVGFALLCLRFVDI